MAKRDRTILYEVTREAMAGAGGMVSARSVFRFLEEIESHFGDRFDIDEACKGLDSLIKIAELAKKSLQERKAKHV